MKLRKIREDANNIWLGWDKIPGVDGYRFYSDNVFRSDTWDANKTEVKFSKAQKTYRVEAIVATQYEVLQFDTYPDPPPTPPPPPPTFLQVAPITVTEEGGSNQRVCLFLAGESGPLRPGVVQRSDGLYTDESLAVYQSNGLEETSIRTVLPPTPGLVSARQMDGRNACQCPTVGSREQNTGSWTV